MRSKTSCFNSAVYKKNLTRFAPVWGLYTLCLVLGIMMVYQAGGKDVRFHFVANLGELAQVMVYVNLVYAPLVAQLLFGDLYNSRMCNAIHAMPLRRDSLLMTNILSGLTFSVVPTLVMTLLCLPLAADSYFAEGWKMPFYLFAASNLEFVCFFGMAVFSTFCAGNRLGMALIYCLLNFGCFLAYFLVDAVYTPMLYGVVTSSDLVKALTPAYYFSDYPLVDVDRIYQMTRLYGEDRTNWVATYRLTEHWKTLFCWAGAGILFTAVSLPLYRKRDLECAGDTLAFHALEPVFQVLISLVCACLMMVFSEFILYNNTNDYIFLFVGLVIGWFVSRMLVERSAKVFGLKNWLKAGALAAVVALTLVLNYFDVFGIVPWQPKLEDIQSIRFYADNNGMTLTEEADFQKILAMHQEALETRLDFSGSYGKSVDGTYLPLIDTYNAQFDKEPTELEDIQYAFDVQIEYTMQSGETVSRRYVLWSDSESGATARRLTSDWDQCVSRDYDGAYRLGEILNNPTFFHIEGMNRAQKDPDKALLEGLVAAVQQDCAEYTMAQSAYLHHGHFVKSTPDADDEFYKTKYVYFNIQGEEYNWSVHVFPDSTHTLEYLRQHDLLNFTVHPEDVYY